jgi:hypothetical protein
VLGAGRARARSVLLDSGRPARPREGARRINYDVAPASGAQGVAPALCHVSWPPADLPTSTPRSRHNCWDVPVACLSPSALFPPFRIHSFFDGTFWPIIVKPHKVEPSKQDKQSGEGTTGESVNSWRCSAEGSGDGHCLPRERESSPR